jgi:hypothetical protein
METGIIITWSLREIDFPEFGNLAEFAEHWLLVLEASHEPLDSIVIHYGSIGVQHGQESYRIETLRDALERSGRDLRDIRHPWVDGGDDSIYYLNIDSIIGIDGNLKTNVKLVLDAFCEEKYESMLHNCQDFIVILSRISGNMGIKTQMDRFYSII